MFSRSRLMRAAMLLTGLRVAVVVAQGVPPRSVTLNDLTVPRERLPLGCALSAAPVLGLPTNPWNVADPAALGSLRRSMGEVPTVTDAPLTRRDASRYLWLLAEGVEEGYAAVYAHGDPERRTIVQAVRFTRRNVDPGRPMKPPNVVRFEIGRIVVVVSGDRGECFQSVEAHVKSLS
jgi:hypothetical protein